MTDIYIHKDCLAELPAWQSALVFDSLAPSENPADFVRLVPEARLARAVELLLAAQTQLLLASDEMEVSDRIDAFLKEQGK